MLKEFNMTNKTIDTRILNYIHSLEKVEQLSVLNYLQKIVKKFRKKNNENEKLLSLAGSINKNDLKKMELAIKEDCENINTNEW